MPRAPQIFARLNQPYYVYAPHFHQTSGGARALHYLCHALNLIGEEAYVTDPRVHPELRTPVLTQTIANAHVSAGRSPIAVYPEVVSDNPLHLQNVARYLLAEPAIYTGRPIDLQPHDQVYTFGPTLVPEGWSADLLRIPLVDTRIFNSEGVEDSQRSGSAVFIHRHIKKGGQLHPITADSIEISYRVPERSAQELADIFRRVECLYMYEHSTVCFEALLCGCPVVFIMNDVSLKEPVEWLMDGKGVSWGIDPEDIARAKATVHEVKEFYAEEERAFWRDLDYFVENTQSKARDLSGKPIHRGVAALSAAKTDAGVGSVASVKHRKSLVVISIEPVTSVCAQTSFIKPFSLLEHEWDLKWGIKDNNVDTALLRRADLIVLQRHTPGLFAPETLKALFDLGKPVIYETDRELSEIPDGYPGAVESKAWKTGIDYLVRHANAVVVSTHVLAKRYRRMNPNVHVLPQYVDFDVFYRPVSNRDDKIITIGITASALNAPNFALVEQALLSICEKYKTRIKLSFIGTDIPSSWKANPAVEFVPFVDHYQDYAEKLLHLNWDIALVPLTGNEYDAGESPVKWMEFAAAGVACILSDAMPYRDVVEHGRTGLLVQDSASAWEEAISSLMDEPQYRKEIAAAAQTEVRQRFSLREQVFTVSQLYNGFSEGVFAPKETAAKIPAVLILDPKGDVTGLGVTLKNLASSNYAGLVTIVLTTRADVPEWTELLRYVQVDAFEFEMAIRQISEHPDFVWESTLEAGECVDDVA